MAIKFVSKNEKNQSMLLDALRLLCWQEHKKEFKCPQGRSGFEFYSQLYQIWAEEWKVDKIHKLSLMELLEFIKGLGYSQNELLNFRANHYQKRNGSLPKENPSEYESEYENETLSF